MDLIYICFVTSAVSCVNSTDSMSADNQLRATTFYKVRNVMLKSSLMPLLFSTWQGIQLVNSTIGLIRYRPIHSAQVLVTALGLEKDGLVHP